MRLSRRQTLMIGGGAAAILGGGVAGRFLLRKRYAPSPYDDLLGQLEDRDAAAQIGETVLAEIEDDEPAVMAARVRAHIAGRHLAVVMVQDASEAKLVEAGGWVLPETLGFICALAAKAAA